MSDRPSAPVRFVDSDRAAVATLLGTTRSVRRRLDPEKPLDLELIEQCLITANQAPSAGDRQPLRWTAVTDPTVRARVADEYQRAYQRFDDARAEAVDEPTRRLRNSSAELAARMPQMPLLLLAHSSEPPPQPAGGQTVDAATAAFWASILPGVWSLQLCLRSHGIGSCLTTVALSHGAAIPTVVQAPPHWSLCAVLPVAMMSGSTLSPARRLPSQESIRWI